VARRATYLDQVWNEGLPVLLVDAGDLFGRRQQVEMEQTRFLCEVTQSFGYDAIGLGEWDLNYGLEFLEEMIREYKLPFTSANVRFPDSGEPILPPYLIVEKGGIRFGIISVLDPEKKIATMAAHDPVFDVRDPVATLRELIPEIRQQAQTIVLLSHMEDKGTEALLKEVQGVDIAVVGHTYRKFDNERALGDVALLSAVHEGRYLGRADLSLDSEGVLQAFSVEVTAMDEKIADDPVVLEKVEAFKARLEEFRLALRGDHQQVKGSDQESFLSERSCRKCHEDAWETLKETRHQSALASLGKKGQTLNPDCLVCHVVGYEYKGGYDDRPPGNRLGNVQCEACHGYGTEHSRDGKYGKRAASSCTQCHDKENSPNFDFATYWEKIKH